ncbi:MAG: class I SAM-dependent methyltransferase [Tateyamaria sp.]
MPAPGHPLHEALFHYYCEFDAVALLNQCMVPGLSPTADALTNFLGTRIPAKIHPDILAPMMGHVEGVPNPGNWHADIAEWAAALRAVSLARDTFRIVELGCGWGCWLVNTGVAARARGLKVDLIGVEGDANHLANAAETLALNGFAPDQFALHHGVAGPKPGKALFPNAAAGTAGWGGEAVFYPDDQTLGRAKADPNVQVLDCLTLSDMAKGAPIDLLHIDIQGAEADYVAGSAAAIAAQVKRVLIGTHSRAIEGRLCAFFLDHGWRLEMDRPAIAPPAQGRPEIAIDGVQMWSNPALPD